MLQFLEGDKMGPTAYYVDVRANPAGWNIFLKRGATIDSPSVLHITKGIRLLWDKGTPVRIEVSPTVNHSVLKEKGGKTNKQTSPFGVNLMRSQNIYQAAQESQNKSCLEVFVYWKKQP